MVIVVALLGLGPPVIKLVSAPPLVVTSLRFWLGLPMLLITARITGKRLGWSVLRQTVLPGALFGVNFLLFVGAMEHATIAVVSVITALQPAVVLVLAGGWLGERPTAWHVCWTVVAIAGVVGVVLGADADLGSDPLGIVLSVASMLAFASYFVLNRRARAGSEISAEQWMAGVITSASLVMLVAATVATSPTDFSGLRIGDWAAVLFVAFFVGTIGQVLLSWLQRFMLASRSSLYLLAMNLVSVLVAWPLHGEPVTVAQMGGGLVVIAAVAAVISRATSMRALSSSPVVAPPVDHSGSLQR